MLDPAFAVIFRPYVYEVIDNGDGQFTLWYALWLPLKDGYTTRSVTVDFIAVADHWLELRKLKPPSFDIIGRGDGDPPALVEVWAESDPKG